MTKLVKFDVGEGQTVLVEVDEVESEEIEPVSKSPGELAARARQTLGESLDNIGPMIRTLKHRLDALTEPADDVEVKFSVKLTGEVAAILILAKGCSSPRNAGIVGTSERAKRARTVERTGVV